MKVIKQSVDIIDLGEDVYRKIELAGRVCYKSENRITDTSSETFIRNLIKRGHESVLEHHNFTLKFITDRGVTHELVRHRIASYSQESTRYCNYAGKDIEFILPVEFYNENVKWNLVEDIQTSNKILRRWLSAMNKSEDRYTEMIWEGASPQLARSVLPNSLKTEIIVTMNIREWRHFFKLRTSRAAHPQMRDLAEQALDILYCSYPVFFEDIKGELNGHNEV